MATKSEVSKRRKGNAEMYAPKPKSQPVAVVRQDPRLRKIAIRMMEELKMPGIPFDILMKGLSEAAAGTKK